MPEIRFVSREDELARLDQWWSAPNARPALLWGRRRVGKTALLQRFARDKPLVFHTGAGRSVAGELAVLSRRTAEAFPGGLRDLVARPYRDWDDALEGLAVLAADEPILVVLDEFPEMIKASPELPGIVRAFLDRTQARTHVRLLVCGSAVRTMQALQEERAPLYGRFDLALHLRPFRPLEASLMLPRLEPEVRALVYGLVGGMPLYLSWWDQDADVPSNLRRLVGQPGAPLLIEGELVLATEVEGGDYPAAVLEAIAAGKTRYNEIKDWVRAEPARTLDRLVELRLVERLLPVTESERSKRRLYRIADPFLAFYLGTLSRYRTEIDRGLGASIMRVLAASLDDHMGAAWEEAFRDHLRRLADAGTLGDVVAVGPWWAESGNHEIDAVALAGRSRAPVLVGEAKWARTVNGRAVRETLAAKAGAGLAVDPETLTYAVAARTRVTALPEGAISLTAADIFPGPPR